MQLTINDMPEPPKGYEYTGEYRQPKIGEWFIDPNDMKATRTSSGYHLPRLILRKKRFRADYAHCYYFVGETGKVLKDYDNRRATDAARHAIGNHFETEAEAQKPADKLKEFLMQFHGGE